MNKDDYCLVILPHHGPRIKISEVIKTELQSPFYSSVTYTRVRCISVFHGVRTFRRQDVSPTDVSPTNFLILTSI